MYACKLEYTFMERINQLTRTEVAQTDLTRNARLRGWTAGGIRRITQTVHEKYPGISPNHITLVGALLEMGGTRLAELQKSREDPNKALLVLAGAMKLTGYSLDAFDGPLSKFKDDHNHKIGPLLDYAADRVEESHAALSRSRTAETSMGKSAANGVAVTSSWPGIARAWSEERGHVVPEHGKNLLEALGTRPGRVALDMIATFSPPRVQTAVDTLGTVANVYSTAQRAKIGRDREVALTAGKRDEAGTRKKMLVTMALANAIIVFSSERKKKKVLG